jgi:hypothetical protein
MSYLEVDNELARGIPPEVLCATCPWDRLCVRPPSMTKAEIERAVKDAEARDEARDPERKAMPAGMLLTAMTLGGRDRMGELCPVFALRLRTPEGRRIADSIRGVMREWSEGGGEP